ncbi:hypothetical protein TK90_2863 (plasmid) [Thioalkalivibrio sp. K90mix]|uniref:hypothetical protein n=1 Tax=Thioalkalivibrio sp. (strain K90mix) TaxID=396595 RepID=UPI000195A8D2|nr:hypothetical protein [Thioalkalivibrio sp. K90mix]ADC73347.1 hypothetical protein TK90_2863 [Thioalkalivibrio sp. K90mix]
MLTFLRDRLVRFWRGLGALSNNAALALSGAGFAISVVVLVLTGLTLTVPDQSRATLEPIAAGHAVRNCEEQAIRLGFQATASDRGLLIELPERGDSATTDIARIDALTQGCPGFQMTDLCIGPDCSAPAEIRLDHQGSLDL